MRAALAGLGLAAMASCAVSAPPSTLATVQCASDLETYTLRRVGLAPVSGVALGADEARSMQTDLLLELGRATRFEVVPLGAGEVPVRDSHQPAMYEPRSVIDLVRRYELDAVLLPTVTDPLSMRIDLVAAETGLVVWSSSVRVEARDGDLRRAISILANEVARFD